MNSPVGKDSPCPPITLDHLSLRYGEHLAFEDVSLEIAAGEITALVGPSGCGKSSLLRCLNRLTDLIENCHITGGIRLGETDVRDPKRDVIALRRRVGLIFQKPNPFPFSIRRNLLLPLEEHGLGSSPGERETFMEQALRDVGLWEEVADRLDAPALRLSGGQQQRLCVARALALQPSCLLLDEATSALDPLSAGVVEDLITSLRGRYTLVLVTHNLSQARRLADKVAVFWVQQGAGRLIEAGSTRQIFESPQEKLTREYVKGMRG
jgi:phosphate transport system ATP-binding protein